MSKKIGKIFFIIGCVFLFLALSLFLYNYYLIKSTEKNTVQLLEKLEKQILINKENKVNEIQYIEIDVNKYIGKLEIPNLNISLPVLKEIDNEKLIISPCKYYGDINQEQLIIAAHNYPKFFGNLKYLNSEDIVSFTDVCGNKINYKVELIESINSTDVSKMINSNFDLTLFTCNNTRTTRITVRCNLIV